MRLFVAVDIPQEIRQALGALIEALREDVSGARWVRPEGIHLTLKFLGEVAEPGLPALRRRLREGIEGAAPPFEVEVAGIGTFPERGHPRVLWVGLRESAGRLAVVQTKVERAVEAAALPGLRKETRPFSPHLTLARLPEGRPPAGLADAIARRRGGAGVRLGAFTVRSICLVQSLLKPSGAEYRKVEEYSL